MFKPASHQNDYSLCSRYDSALDLPVVPVLADDASTEDVAARDKVQAELDLKMKNAREQNAWATIVKPGHTATIFTFRQVPRTAVNWWLGELERKGKSHVEGLELLFRLALKEIANCGTLKVESVEEDGYRLVSTGTMDALYAIGGGIGLRVVGELGTIVLEKTRGIDPLS